MNALYGIEPLSKEIAVDIRNLLNLANVCISEFRRLHIAIDSCDHWLVHHLLTKLPISTTQAWEHSLGNNVEIPTFTKLKVFLHNRLVSIDLIESRKPAVPVKSSIQSTNHRQTTRPSENSTVRGHSFHSTLESGSIRCSLCQQNHVLRRCPDFLAKDCFARKSMQQQPKLLAMWSTAPHFVTFPECSTKSFIDSWSIPTAYFRLWSERRRNTKCTINATLQRNSTALVRIVNNSTGQSALVRALIDHGSEGTLITENIVQALRLKRHPVRAEITGIGNTSHNQCRHSTDFTIISCSGSDFNAYVSSAFNLRSLTDPNFIKSGRIDLLIGVDIIPQLMLPDIRKETVAEPIAQNTQLGWIVFGPAEAAQTTSISIRCNLANLNNMVQRFFELDQVSTTRQLNAEEKWCEDHFQQTHIRQPNGKYLVRLPLKTLFDPTQVIGRSRQIALNRFHALERKLNHRPDFSQQYASTIQEYFDLKQIKEVKGSEEEHTRINAQRQLSISACTVPHHAVIKDDSLTTKMRVVYDDSCKTSNGRSLNDILCTGPALQNDLGGVILNWRLHRYVFVADITKMYRCIDMHEEDAHNVWHCLGTLQIASDERKRYPLAEHVLKKEIYVDDVQTGHETIDGALKIRNDVIAALQSAGMELKKWASNHPDILESIPTTDLSNIARLFDPLGYLAPVIIAAKILLKEVWSFRIERKDEPPASLDWDDPLPDQLAERWRQLIKELPDIEEIHIPLWLGFDLRHVSTLQLHMFCDGSSMAYAACAYLRASCMDGSVQVNLLAARSRVTPVKPLTIPRVELSGALLCTQLADWIVNQRQASHHTISVHYWSDAMIVLYWISGDLRRWKTFVSNRIGAILEASSPSQWRHVLTQENPANCATRGLTPSQLKHHTLWWNGPHWLHLSEERWPVNPVQSPKSELISGEQSLKHIGAHISYVKRFIYNTRHKKADRLTGPIQVSEFQQALFALVRMVQQEVYSEELSRLRSNKFLSKHNKLSQLSPFLDDEGLMRALKNALQLSMSQRTPIILPKAHHLTILVIRNAHHNTLHGGVQLTLSTIHQVFWIVNGKQAVKRILRQCVTCFKHRPSPSSQLMGDLPAHRVNPPKRAFEATGVDYTEFLNGQRMFRLFWRKWSADWLSHLQARPKWRHETDNLQRNDMIIIKDDRTGPSDWKLGRIIDLPPGADGLVRVATIKTSTGIYKRVDFCSTLTIGCESSQHDETLEVLTPAHFLKGSSYTKFPEPDITHLREGRLSRWQRVTQMQQHFWKRWSSEYLSLLQERSKWRVETSNIKEVIPGGGGVIQVAMDRTATGLIKRAVAKLAVLPIDSEIVGTLPLPTGVLPQVLGSTGIEGSALKSRRKIDGSP
ncbi:uncharacterized protein [Drosophila suzukii]|uniref:Uncharacterized protein n=1 Tax=Drosophila suzukii TaxID=28584 RepID=A0ABM4U057_DROSZ